MLTSPSPDPVGSATNEKPSSGGSVTPQPQLVKIQTLKVPFSAAWLANEADIEDYLQSLRQRLLDEISKGRRIQI